MANFTQKALKACAVAALVVSACSVANAQDKLYLTDVYTIEDLNSDVFGVPQCCDKAGDGMFVARYYNQKVNNAVYFLGNKTDFTDVYGLKGAGLGKGMLLEEVDPIILPEAGKYYEITVNVNDMSYEAKTYEVADYMDPIFYEYGAEVFNTWESFVPGSDDEYLPSADAWLQPFFFGTGDSPSNIEPFVQDPNNKHLYMWAAPQDLEAGEMNFIIHNKHSHGWWDAISWRVDNDKECDIFMYYGTIVKRAYLNWAFGPDCDWKSWNEIWDYRKNFVSDIWCHPVVKTPGQYMLYFDSHLGRAKLVPYNGTDGIESLQSCSPEGPAVYYNLQGVRVDKPTSGLYIKRQGNTSIKVFLR